MELSQLRTFRVVAETLNFTRAAERLNLTQSAVSHQIKSLEMELGEPIFIRAKRGVKLSQAGQAALEHAIRILDEAQTLKERVLGRESAPVGRVRVAAATQAFVHLFAPIFESFMRTNPGVDLSFRSTVSTDTTVADILNGAADVGFASLPVYSPTLKVTDLFEDELVLVVGHGHKLAGRDRRPRGDPARRAAHPLRARRPPSAAPPTSSSTRWGSTRRSPSSRTTPTSSRSWSSGASASRSCPPGRCATRWPGAGWPSCASRATASAGRWRPISLGRFQPSATRAFLDYMLERKGELQAMAEGEPRKPA